MGIILLKQSTRELNQLIVGEVKKSVQLYNQVKLGFVVNMFAIYIYMYNQADYIHSHPGVENLFVSNPIFYGPSGPSG